MRDLKTDSRSLGHQSSVWHDLVLMAAAEGEARVGEGRRVGASPLFLFLSSLLASRAPRVDKLPFLLAPCSAPRSSVFNDRPICPHAPLLPSSGGQGELSLGRMVLVIKHGCPTSI